MEKKKHNQRCIDKKQLTSGFRTSTHLYNPATAINVMSAAHQLIINMIAIHNRNPRREIHML